MAFSEHFTLLEAVEIMTPMEIVVNYDTSAVVEQLNTYSAEIDINDFITKVIEEAEETAKVVEVFVTMSNSLKR